MLRVLSKYSAVLQIKFVIDLSDFMLRELSKYCVWCCFKNKFLMFVCEVLMLSIFSQECGVYCCLKIEITVVYWGVFIASFSYT